MFLKVKYFQKKKNTSFTQVKVVNTSENLLNKIRQIIISLHRPKESFKKLNDK